MHREEKMFLASISDTGERRLRAMICVGGHRLLPREILGKHVDEISAMPIERSDALYVEFGWKRYFSFMVRDEVSAAFRRDESFVRRGIRLYSDSWLLRSMAELSNGLHGLAGGRETPIKHFGFYCSDHIVDILSWDFPEIRDLGMRWSPEVGQGGSLNLNKRNDPHVKEAPPAQS